MAFTFVEPPVLFPLYPVSHLWHPNHRSKFALSLRWLPPLAHADLQMRVNMLFSDFKVHLEYHSAIALAHLAPGVPAFKDEFGRIVVALSTMSVKSRAPPF